MYECCMKGITVVGTQQITLSTSSIIKSPASQLWDMAIYVRAVSLPRPLRVCLGSLASRSWGRP